jgi:hypothetical protein
MASHREIIEHDDFKAARRAIDIDVRLLDEIMEGVVDVIARIPETFGMIDYTRRNLRAVATRDWAEAGKPRFIIFFSFDAETVTLEYIHRHELDDRD